MAADDQLEGQLQALAAYIPMDRRQTLAAGRDLPDRARGAVLFADISGFTPLTEALVRELGPRRGADELTQQLNRVYTTVIARVHTFRGTVIGFSGDAITCWFDGDNGLRGTACALAIEAVMEDFSTIAIPSGPTVSLAMKASVAAGPVRRFLVGDPAIQYIDVMAGAVLDRVAAGEHLAEKGEVIVGPRAMAATGSALETLDRRRDAESGDIYAVVRHGSGQSVPAADPWQPTPGDAFTVRELRPWLLSPVFDRLASGQGRFLAELRPAVPLFLRFGGLDYEGDDDAGKKLDAYVRWVQGVFARYEGFLIQLTIGDKGSYLYAAFGAPIAHEDDAERAVSAALELRSAPTGLVAAGDVQIGISTGRMRTGAYGSPSRLTYGVLGDEVNLAARLMQAAGPGQILITQHVADAVSHSHHVEYVSLLTVKGKRRPVPVHTPLQTRGRRRNEPRESQYAIPMVGREEELAALRDTLALAMQGRGQVVGITGEAGIGKSRLASELVRMAYNGTIVLYLSDCESYGTNTSYLVWWPVFRAMFEVDSSWPIPRQIEVVAERLSEIGQRLLPRLPLLGAVLNIPIPDNDLTRTFDAKLRKTSLEALVVDCVRSLAASRPTLFVLEDCHWLDPLSRDLIEVVARSVADLPVMLALVYRPPERELPHGIPARRLPHFTEIGLHEFTAEESQELITLKLRQFSGPEADVPGSFIARVTERAQGNPFYIEELLNYLRDRGIDPQDTASVLQLDLPTSLHTLILSRLDQRTESQRITIRVASVIGRVFRAALLWGMYPEIGVPERVLADLVALTEHDLTQVDTPEPELAYLFKHIVTQEVAYESLPFATRAMLHEQLAIHIEQAYSQPLDQYVDLLAFHFERSENDDKKREYLRKAGEAAQADYANEAAISYYQRLLPLLPVDQRVPVMLQLGEVLQLVGRWDEAGELCEVALTAAAEQTDGHTLAHCQVRKGEMLRIQGLYTESAQWFRSARSGFERLGDREGVGEVLHYTGTLAAQQGDYDKARSLWEESLTIRRELDDERQVAALLSNLAVMAEYRGDYGTARALNEECLALRTEIGDRWAIANSLNNLGNVILAQGDCDAARERLDRAVALYREVGDRWRIANALNNLGNVSRAQGDLDEARALYEESLTINSALGDGWAIAYLLEDIGVLSALRSQPARALRLTGAAAALREAINAPLPPADQEKLEANLAPARAALGDAAAEAVSEGGTMSMEDAVTYAQEPA
jgi:class 3 adenylate cyclase/tetratricopeptide (TPR) repeat protein